MLAQVERLGRLVQRLLDLSRLESGAVPLDRREFELAPMIELAVRETRLHAGSVQLRVEVEPETLALDGDAERLHQVVANLVENAVRHSPPEGHVLVRATAAGPDVRIDVTDEGPGIPAAEATRVFERFYRADNARSSDHGGAGLGLAIARWIVDLHDGEVHVESRQPHGARMVVTLPRRVDAVVDGRDDEGREQPTPDHQQGERTSVLATTQPTEKGR
jgi:signal transduction histidine kinase